MRNEVSYLVNIYRDSDGQYTAVVPAFNYASTCGETHESALEMAKEMIAGYIGIFAEEGTQIPESDNQTNISTSFLTIDRVQEHQSV